MLPDCLRAPFTRVSAALAPRESNRTLWAVLVVLAGVLGADRLNARFGWWMTQAQVRTLGDTAFYPNLWRLSSSKPVPWHEVSPLQINVVSAAGRPLVFTPNPDRVTEFPNLTFTCDRKGHLLLDPAWQLNAFFRSGSVMIRFPKVLPPALATVGWFVLGICLLRFCGGTSAQELHLRSWRRYLVKGRGLLAHIGRHPIVFLSLPSLYFLLAYPPAWKDVDAACQLIYGVSAASVFHFPALFCILARVPMWLGTALGHPAAFSPFTEQHPSLVGIYTLVVLQHAFLVAGLRAFIMASSSEDLWRGIGVVLVQLAPGFYAQAHLCGSESWSLIATLFLFAFGLRILQRNRQLGRAWAGYGLALVFAVGSRHINVLLGVWLVAMCPLYAFLSARQDGRRAARWLVQGAIAVAILLSAVWLNRELANRIGKRYGLEPRSTLGRTLSDRIGTFLEKLSMDERARLAGRLIEQTPDPAVQAALRIQATVGRLYEGGDRALAEYISRQGFSGEHAAAECDRVELRAMLVYLRTLHPQLLKVIGRDVRRGFTGGNSRSLAMSTFSGSIFAAIFTARDPRSWESLQVLKNTRFPDAAIWYDVALADQYLELFHRVTVVCMLVILAGAWWIALQRGTGSREEILLWGGVVFTGVLVFAATCVCVYFMARYVLPLYTAAWLALVPSLEIACRRRESAGGPVPPPQTHSAAV